MAERETLEVDVLIVGGGPAGMSAALRLAQLQKEKGGEPLAIAVLEKARETGAHMLSGAVLDPSALRDLVPDFKQKGAPLASQVDHDAVYFLTRTGKVKFPITPPPLHNHGNYVISVNRFVKWLGGLVEAEGIDVFTGFAASELLFDGATRRRGAHRRPRHRQARREEGHLRARRRHSREGHDSHRWSTRQSDQIAGPAAWASTKDAARSSMRSASRNCGRFRRIASEAGSVIHTMGYPLKMDEFGGGFIYAMPDGVVSVGFVSGLDYRDPMFDPHIAFQHFKRHPLVAPLLQGGQMVRYGAKALPEGGWHTIPRVYADGVLIAGDAAGFLNSMRLKGMHLAMRTGMLAAETAFEAVRAGDVSAGRLEGVRRTDRDERCAPRALSRAERSPEFQLRLARGRGVLRTVAPHTRLVVQGSDACPRRLCTDGEARRLL